MDTQLFKELQDKLLLQTDEKSKINLLIDIAVEIRNADIDEAMSMAEDILLRAKSISYINGIGRGLNLKGSCHWLKGEYHNGLIVLKESLAIAEKTKDRALEARALHNIGNIYRDLGDLANVLSNYEKALYIHEELGDEYSQSIILTSISNLLYDLNDFDSALEYALKCLPIFERVHNLGSLITIYNTLGNIYFKKEEFVDALHYFEENLNRSDIDTIPYVMAESGLGKVYYKMHNFESARKYLTNALSKSEHLGNAEVQIICQFYLGRLFMDDDNYRQALINLNNAYTLAEEYLRRQDLMSIHEMLSAVYDKMGDIPKAFHHLKTFQKLKEEIFKQTTINELRNLQVRQQIELAQKEKEVAERTAFLKHQFLANMSHEIRTPMNAIVGMIRLLLAKEYKPEQLKYLNAIQQSANNLLVIINDILDISKIESGKIVIEQTDFSLGGVIKSVHDMMMLRAEEKHIEFRVNIDAQIPKRLSGDPNRLNQILINLTGNAVKFTNNGYVEVRVGIQKTDTDIIWIIFDVIDTGIGISAEYVETIFDSFTQAGTDVARKFGGTGLGLTISKQLVSLMGGDISVKSELHKGTTFTCIIPFHIANMQEEIKECDILDKTELLRLNNLKILLVEDNEFNRMVAEDTLQDALPLISIDFAANGKEALEQLEKNSYDLVLMDIQMPVMDGMTATKIIRTTFKEPIRSTKIIAMTANVLQEDVAHYLEAGMDAYISKPFQTEELLLKMDALIDKTKLINATNKKPARPIPNLPEFVTDRQFLKTFTSGNNEKAKKYIGMFLDNAPRLLANMQAALEAKDYVSLKIAAHSLKPQLSYMGVPEETSKIFLIEQTAGSSAHYDTLDDLLFNLKHVCNKAFEELSK